MRESRRVLVVLACAQILMAGCGGTRMQYKRVDAAKTAAIVGVSAALNTYNRTQGKGSGTIGAAQEMASLGSDAKIAERKVQGNAIYDALAAEINKSLGWTIKGRDEVVADAANKAIYDRIIGVPNKLQLGGLRVYVPGILWTERVKGLNAPDRKKLLESLGVDALVFVHINYYVGATGPVRWKVGKDGVFTVSGAIPGTSAAYPAARIGIKIFDDSPEPIWNSGAAGEPSRFGIVTTKGIEHKTDMVPILEDALSSSWVALMNEFEEDKAKSIEADQEAAAD